MGFRDHVQGLQDLLLDEFAGDDLFDYTPAAGGPSTAVRGVFMDPGEIVEVGTEGDMVSIAPRLDVLQSDLPGGAEPGIRDGSTFTRQADGRVYEVAEIQPDGHGILHLELLDLNPK